MNCRVYLLAAAFATTVRAQGEPGPYARIAIMRALDGHAVDLEAGY